MKHIKEFRLNEKIEDGYNHRNFEEFKRLFIGDLIEDLEYTDVFLEKEEIKEKIDDFVKKLSIFYEDQLIKFHQNIDNPLQSPVERAEKKLPRYDKNYRPNYGRSYP